MKLTSERGLPIPPRFEDECPEEAKILMDICEENAEAQAKGKRPKPLFLDGMEQVVSEIKVGRNDPCPCGSGRKFKKCCA